MRNKLTFFLGLVGLVATLGCAGPSVRDIGGGGSTKVYDYAGTYAGDVSVRMTDSTGADEANTWTQDIVAEQYGPAVKLAGLLGLADATGLAFDSSTHYLHWLAGETFTTTVGASAGDNPLRIEVTQTFEYPDFDGGYDATYAYTITLGERLYE